MTAIRRERIPLLWSTVRKEALAKGFNLTGDGPGAWGGGGRGVTIRMSADEPVQQSFQQLDTIRRRNLAPSRMRN